MTLNLGSCLTLSKFSTFLKRILSFPTISSPLHLFLQAAKTILNSNAILSFTSVQLPVDYKFNIHTTLLSRLLIKMKEKWPTATPTTPRNSLPFWHWVQDRRKPLPEQSCLQPSSAHFQIQFNLWNHAFPFCKPPSLFAQKPLQILSYNQVQQMLQINNLRFSFGAGLHISWGTSAPSEVKF